MNDLWSEIIDLQNNLTIAGKQMQKYGNSRAEAERDYRISVNEHVMKLRDEGMPATLINQTVYGIPEVAQKRFKRDVADVMYETSKEAINTLKLKIRIYSEQLSREWYGGQNG